MAKKKPIEFNQENFNELKKRFEEWSGFGFEADSLESAIENIEDMKYKLECEISDYARGLESLAKETFPEE